MNNTIRTLTALGLLAVALLLLPALASAQPFHGHLTPTSVKVYGPTTMTGALTVHGAMTATTGTLTILNLAPTNLTPTNLTVSSSAKLPETTPTANRQAGFDNGVLKWYYGSLRTGLYDVTASSGLTATGSGATRALTIDRSVVVTNPVAGDGLTGGGAPSAGLSTLAVGAGTGITVTANAVAIDRSVVVTNPAAGAGLTGGGAPVDGISTIDAAAGTGINVSADAISIDPTVVVTDITGGAGLSAGGGPSGGTVTLSVNAGPGITTTGDAVAINPAAWEVGSVSLDPHDLTTTVTFSTTKLSAQYAVTIGNTNATPITPTFSGHTKTDAQFELTISDDIDITATFDWSVSVYQ